MIYRNWEHYWSEGKHGYTSASKDLAKEIWDDFEPTIKASQDDYKQMYLDLCKEGSEFRSQYVDAMREYIDLFSKEDAPNFSSWWVNMVQSPNMVENVKNSSNVVENLEPHIVAMCGVPCSGKTTYSQNHYPDYTRISWDEILIEKYPANTYDESFRLSNFKEMDRLYHERLQDALRANKNIVVDLTLISRKSRLKRLVDIPERYKKTVVVCQTTEKKFHARNAKRSEGGKTVPDSVFRDMAKAFQFPTEEEGFSEIIRNLT